MMIKESSALIFWARRLALAAAFVGLFASAYLLTKYITRGPIVCGTTLGCEIVRGSPYAYPFGIPLPLFGTLFYSAMVFLLILRAMSPRLRPNLLTIFFRVGALLGFADSVFLTGVQAWSIGAFCAWCLVSAGASTTLFAASLIDRTREVTDEEAVGEMRWAFATLFVAFIVGGAGMMYLLRS